MSLKNVEYNQFMKTMNDLNAVGPEVEFEDDCTTEDWWNPDHTKVVGFSRYWDTGEVQHIITGY